MAKDLTKMSKKANKAWKKYSYGTRPRLHRGKPVNYESALDKAMKGSPFTTWKRKKV